MNIVVTGATKGIGKAIVEAFAAKGANVAFNSRNETNVAALKADLEAKYNKEVIGIACDMSKKDQILDFCTIISKKWNQVDILVNNAGLFLPGNLLDSKAGDLDLLLQTNLMSAFHVTKNLIDDIKQSRKGHIFNISSVAGLQAYPNGGLYAVSKFALTGFSKSIREELKEDKIRVTTVYPGATLTDSWKGVEIPPDRFMTPEDIAAAIVGCYDLSVQTVIEDLVLRPQLGDI